MIIIVTMVESPRTLTLPTGEELADSVAEKFQRDVLPVLEENLRWRARSRRIDIETCPPGCCPKPGEWPVYKSNLDESD